MKRGQENITDEELLKRYCESGDLAYFVEAYKRYMPLVYGVASKYLKRPEDAGCRYATIRRIDCEGKRDGNTILQSLAIYLYSQ